MSFINIDNQSSSKLVLLFTVSKHIYGLNTKKMKTYFAVWYTYHRTGRDMLALTHMLKYNRKYCGDSKHVLVFGDFNSRTKDLSESTEVDGFISDVFGTENLLSENASIFDCFEQYDIPFERKSADNTVNQYGYSLIDFCKNNNLLILNDRIGDDYRSPKLMCKNRSTVDHFLASPFVFGSIDDLCVYILMHIRPFR